MVQVVGRAGTALGSRSAAGGTRDGLALAANRRACEGSILHGCMHMVHGCMHMVHCISGAIQHFLSDFSGNKLFFSL